MFDRDSQQLVLRNTAENNGDLELANCPYCHRPLHNTDTGPSTHHASPGAQPQFINPNYFRMLHDSLPSSATSSHAPSPSRSLVQPALPDRPIGRRTSEPGSSGTIPAAQGISSTAFSPNYFQKFFVEEKVLGRGGKGLVLLVNHVLDGVSLGHYACKRVPVGDDHSWLERVLGEVQLLQHLSHQNLVSYRHVWLENARINTFGPSVPCAFILQQYCNAGDLHNYIYGSMQTSSTPQQLKERIRRRSKGEPEPPAGLVGPRKLHFDEIYSIFKDITSGLRYLHINGYIHRDLKPSNCLLHETSDGLRVLVSDFGEVQSQAAIRRSTGATGTVSYCAPEVLRREYPGGPFGNFSFKSDIFSLGMILYFLCFAELPYSNADLVNEEKEDLDQLREEITRWAGFDDVRRKRPELPDKLYIFLERLLSVDPNRRPSADEVLIGIQAGVSANENFRFKRAGSVGQDMHSSSRIHPIDSSTGPSIARSPRSPTRALPQSPATMRHGSLYESNHTRTSSTAMEDPELEPNLSLSPDRNLIVRARFPSAAPQLPNQSEAPQVQQEEHPVPQVQLLPPSSTSSSLPFTAGPRSVGRSSVSLALFTANRPLHLLIQASLFLIKAISVFQPCTPQATNSWILYPLIFLAAISLRVQSSRIQAISFALHLIIVGLSMHLEHFCIRDST